MLEGNHPVDHIDERTLELHVLGAGEVASRSEEIRTHLTHCAGCTALHRDIAAFYAEMERISREQRQRSAEALVVRNMMPDLPPWARGARPDLKTLPMKARIVLFALRHPAVSSLSAAALFAAGLFLMNVLQAPHDVHPSYARAEKEFLVVYNGRGTELWRKHVGPGYDAASLPGHERGSLTCLAAADVDGDGSREVLSAFRTDCSWGKENELVCFTSTGERRWVYTLSRRMTFGSEAFADRYIMSSVLTGDWDGDGRVEVIAHANHRPYYPAVVLKLDGSTGALEGEYWHPGALDGPIVRDAGSTGAQQIFFVGENNGLGSAVVLVLDPRTMAGAAPAPPAYTPRGVGPGTQTAYVAFPSSALTPLAEKRPTAQTIIFLDGGSIAVSVNEKLAAGMAGLVYHFDDRFTCTRVVGNDLYVTLHDRLFREGALPRPAESSYFEELRRGVRSWIGPATARGTAISPP